MAKKNPVAIETAHPAAMKRAVEPAGGDRARVIPVNGSTVVVINHAGIPARNRKAILKAARLAVS